MSLLGCGAGMSSRFVSLRRQQREGTHVRLILCKYRIWVKTNRTQFDLDEDCKVHERSKDCPRVITLLLLRAPCVPMILGVKLSGAS